jgi:adenosyl cobinamide kinase/adenosyl cobinamide phosphate guanylyltransferase
MSQPTPLLTLVLGGTRSGKSATAERLAAEAAVAVTYLATATLRPDDADHATRIARHQSRRPSTWVTVECPDPTDLVAALRATTGVVLVDSLGTWVTGHTDLIVDHTDLLAALRDRAERGGPTVIVSEEVGLAVHPPTELGRRFVDALGELNTAVAAIADRVLLVVAGRSIELPPC